MKFWIVCLFFIVLQLQLVNSSFCNGEHEYIAADGSCKQCEMCPAGSEPTPYHCGYGERDSLYSCKPCDYGTYSVSTDYNFCRTCSPCQKWHAVTTYECTSISNSRCGACFAGYFRPQKADGRSDIECHKCKDDTDPSCQTTNWLLITIVLSSLCFVALVCVAVFGCKLLKSRKNKRNSTSKPTRREPTPIIPCNTSMSTSCEILTMSPSTDPKRIRHNLSEKLLIDFEGNTYSNQPTAQFEQSDLYHQLPTAQFRSHHSVGARTNGTSCFGSVDQLRRNVDTFDTNSLENPTTSILNHESLP